MQESYFVVPDKIKTLEGLERVTAIKNDLNRNNYKKTVDFIEAKSLATVAYLILKDTLVKNF
jgi:L-aspartate oxidase